SFQGVAVVGDPEFENVSSPAEVGSPWRWVPNCALGSSRKLSCCENPLLRWVIRHGLCLAMMKCVESLEMRQAFADVVSAEVAKGMSEGLKHEVEHGYAQRTVESLEAYDPEAEAKFSTAIQSLKDLKYPLLDQLEGLKDAPMDVIMAALYLESDTGRDAL
nr:transposase (putative), gypsy type [Tanacetum cinerariifolium]